ncbi:hypothetical protein [Paenibacillus glycanilyticus]|uniref:hypothetical protein n=1 Tax=Paenibacillus glycanilyticus TaxID=126569 RepID=UPI00190FD344|nr:hypothetical protein [Paenibacillus glycanilyticus]
MKLYHYYDESTGPFKNLSDLDIEEAEIILDKLRSESKGFASKRSKEYIGIRQELEEKARLLFIRKGGKPTREAPHYMTLGSCPWLLEWFENGCELSIPVENFDPSTVSFTYGDLFPTMRVQDEKKYRGQVYSLDEINELVTELGFPQDWNPYGDRGPERYIEAQIWDNTPLTQWMLHTNGKR